MRDFKQLNVPPVGKVEAQVTGPVSLIRWAPGNGVVYQLIVTTVSDEIKRWTGGSVMLSLMGRDGQTYRTYYGNPGGLYHMNYVEEKWGNGLSEEDIYYSTALMNWAMFDDDIASQYAKEIFEEAMQRWRP